MQRQSGLGFLYKGEKKFSLRNYNCLSTRGGDEKPNVPGNFLSMKKTTKLTVYLKHKRGSWVSLRPQGLNEKN